MKKFLKLLIFSLLLANSLAFANTTDRYSPDFEYCENFEPDLLLGSDMEIIKSCKCFYNEDLRLSLNILYQSEVIFEEGCRNVNLSHDCIYKNLPDRIITIDKIKQIDENNNCLIDTNHEKCVLKYINIMRTSSEETISALNEELFGCYGNSAEPTSLIDFEGEDKSINSFQVFDEEKGLIANQEQKQTLKNLSENKAGPVIGFINMIINYLASIVFVLCMGSLIYGGYNLIFAGFDSDMQEKGKNAIKYAITGFFLIMLSYTIVILVQSIF